MSDHMVLCHISLKINAGCRYPLFRRCSRLSNKTHHQDVQLRQGSCVTVSHVALDETNARTFNG